MSQYINDYPVRILVVEDQEPLREVCVGRLKRRFPRAQFAEAGSRLEAIRLITEARDQRLPYDVAILDLRLPNDVGGLEVSDTSLARMIIEDLGGNATLLIQWTSYPDDPAVSRALREIAEAGGTYCVISKAGLEWPGKMEEFIRRHIAEKTVGRWLDHPYFRQMRDQSLAVISRRPGAARAPVDIPAFVLRLIDVWPWLEPHRRQEAIATFKDTEWEIAQLEGGVQLTNAKTIEAVEDARENARIFAEVIGSHSRPE